MNEPSIVGCISFEVMFGETLKDKFESLYVKIVELTNLLIVKGASGYFHIITSPYVAEWIQTSNAFKWNKEHIQMGIKNPNTIGHLANRWKVIIDPNIEDDQLLIGTDTLQHPTASLKISGFAI